MNFQELYRKIQAIDEGKIEECGMAPMPPHEGQQDSVNMNVTMSGSGEGGIRDLLAVLKNIETGTGEPSDSDDSVVIGGADIADVQAELDDSYNNEPNEEVAGIDAVTPTGNDIHSKGDEAEKSNGGGNPWRQTEVSEGLLNRLSQHYQEVKDR